MKKYILFLLLIFSLSALAQDSNNTIRYNFKYAYYLLEPRNGGSDKIIPIGRNCIVNYDTFYKKYYISWTDQKGIIAGNYFYYIPSDIEKENVIMAHDDNGGKYVIINKVKELDAIILVDQNYNKDFLVRMVLANREWY